MIPASSIDIHALMRGLVHELRNPLSAILTASSLLKGGQTPNLDEESAMLLEVVEKESRRMNRILTEFTSFVKPPAARPETFDLAQTLRGLIAEMQRDETLPRGVKVKDDLPDQLIVYADQILSQQAFHHLFNNAVEAMTGGGTLHLHAQSDEKTATVFLDDSGMGLPEAAIEHAFQPFFSTKSAATGLGLSIANSLISASAGQISLHHGPEDALSRRVMEPAAMSGLPSPPKTRGARLRVELPRGK